MTAGVKILLAFVALAGLLAAAPARADIDVVREYNVAQNDVVAAVCDSMYLALLRSNEYLTYDPEQDRSALTDNGPNMSSGDTLVLSNTFLTRPVWSDMASYPIKPLSWHKFNRDDHDKFLSFMDRGEDYGRSYAAYRSYSNLYGRIVLTTKEPIYKFVPKSRVSNMKMPELYMTPGSGLARVVDNLHAQDIVLYGARGFPVVREPGKVVLYEIDVDRDDAPYDQQKFSVSKVCSFGSLSTLARRKKALDDAAAAALPPAAAAAPAAARDCKDKSGAAYSDCIAAQKLSRLRALKERQDGEYKKPPP